MKSLQSLGRERERGMALRYTEPVKKSEGQNRHAGRSPPCIICSGNWIYPKGKRRKNLEVTLVSRRSHFAYRVQKPDTRASSFKPSSVSFLSCVCEKEASVRGNFGQEHTRARTHDALTWKEGFVEFKAGRKDSPKTLMERTRTVPTSLLFSPLCFCLFFSFLALNYIKRRKNKTVKKINRFDRKRSSFALVITLFHVKRRKLRVYIFTFSGKLGMKMFSFRCRFWFSCFIRRQDKKFKNELRVKTRDKIINKKKERGKKKAFALTGSTKAKCAMGKDEHGDSRGNFIGSFIILNLTFSIFLLSFFLFFFWCFHKVSWKSRRVGGGGFAASSNAKISRVPLMNTSRVPVNVLASKIQRDNDAKHILRRPIYRLKHLGSCEVTFIP